MSKKDKAAARTDRAADNPQLENCLTALREDRVAILPDWLQEGRTVWFWRETYCFDNDLCSDSVTPSCPWNGPGPRNKEKIHKCSRKHPVLISTEVWAVSAIFDVSGVIWCVNDAFTVRDCLLKDAFFPSRIEALKHRPEEVVYG